MLHASIAHYTRPYGQMHAIARRVWHALTLDPRSSYREISRATGIPLTSVRMAVDRLIASGYIERSPRRSRTCVVVVPFAEVRRCD